ADVADAGASGRLGDRCSSRGGGRVQGAPGIVAAHGLAPVDVHERLHAVTAGHGSGQPSGRGAHNGLAADLDHVAGVNPVVGDVADGGYGQRIGRRYLGGRIRSAELHLHQLVLDSTDVVGGDDIS